MFTLFKKTNLFFSLLLSLFGCAVAAISTLAWFQLDQRPIQSKLVSSDPNISIADDSVYGYKINQGIGDTGFINYDSEDVVKFAASGIAGTNHHQDSSDTNFNVPDDGIGYYLIRKNPGGTFKYKYTSNGVSYTSYSWKFVKYDQTHITRAFVSSVEVTSSDITNNTNVFRVTNYYFSNNKTVNTQVSIASVFPTDSFLDKDTTTTDVTCTAAGTYKVWLNFSTNELSFELITLSSGGVPIRSRTKTGRQNSLSPNRAAGSTTGSVNGTKLYLNDKTNNWTKDGDPHAVLDTVVFDSNSGYQSISDVPVNAYPLKGDWAGTVENVGYAVKMCWVKDDGVGKEWEIQIPWFVESCYVSFYAAGNYKLHDKNGGDLYRFQILRSYNYYVNVNPQCDRAANNVFYATINRGTVVSDDGKWTYTETKYTIAFDSNGGSAVPDAEVWKYGKVPQPNNPTKDNLTFSHWELDDSEYVFDTVVTSFFTLTAVYNGTISLYASYFINGVQSSLVELLDSPTVSEGKSYTVSGYSGNRDYNDETNGVHYTFSREGSTWYTAPNCTEETAWTNPSTISNDIRLYAKFNVAFTNNYTTFYIDSSDAIYNTDENTRWDDTYIMFTDGSAATIKCIKVASSLYRVTLPNSYEFRLGNGITGDVSFNINFSTSVLAEHTNLPSSHVGSILYIAKATSNANHDFYWCSEISDSVYGTAKIQRYINDEWTDLETMDTGDGASNNYFIYEHGLQLAHGVKIRVKISGDNIPTVITTRFTRERTYYVSKWSAIYEPNTAYLESVDEYACTKNYSTTERFNIYVTNTGHVSITMVPDYGNGFYIMPYQSTYGTNSFLGSIKMTSNSDVKATYEGFYATRGSRYYIRSYINAVDVPYTALASNSLGVTMVTDKNESDYGVITFTNPDYYTLVVMNDTVYVYSYTINSSFKLNKLDTDTSKVRYAKDIWSQKTSLVLEVPFTCDNNYESSISLTVEHADTNPLSDFVGVSLYVSKHQISKDSTEGTDPYHFMRGNNASTRTSYYNNLSNAATVLSQNSVTVNETDFLCYAYILIDYLPTTEGGVSGDSLYEKTNCIASDGVYSGAFLSSSLLNSVSFYLTAEQA